MNKDYYLVGRSECNEVRQVRVHLGLHVGLRFAHSDLQFIMMINQLEMVLHIITLSTMILGCVNHDSFHLHHGLRLL